MRQNYWKFLGIAILIYTVVVGMSVPLKPGIMRMDSLSIGEEGNDSLRITEGETHVFRIAGYNSHYQSSETKAWLKIDDADAKLVDDFKGAFPANKVKAISETEAEIEFRIPNSFPLTRDFVGLTLVLSNTKDGHSIMPGALSVRNLTKNTDVSLEWDDEYLSQLEVKPGMLFPYRSVLHETVRNTFFHIPLWFSMFIMLIISLVYSILYLKSGDLKHDIYASAMVSIAVLFGVLGIITGSLWAKYTWGTFWTSDVKLNMSTVAMLIYVASLILRSSITDIDRRAKLSASYNIFAFVALIPLVFILPRLTDSLHPGNGGNPALGGEDMDNTLRMVFYPAIIGFTLLGLWMTSIVIRYELIKDKWMSRTWDDKSNPVMSKLN